MIHRPFWLTTHLALIIRPYGEVPLDDHMRAFREAGIDVIVSMLQKGEARNLGLEDEEASANRAGLLFENFPIADGSVPANQLQFIHFLECLENHIFEGRKIAIHCRASIGRAPLTAASLLIRSGMTPGEAWSQIASIRDCPVPDTPNQRKWVDTNIKLKV
jgi:protein-tyrosine phosphatase